jgi:hypothetical protein
VGEVAVSEVAIFVARQLRDAAHRAEYDLAHNVHPQTVAEALIREAFSAASNLEGAP